MRATLQRDDRNTSEPQVRTIFGWLAEQVIQRNPDGQQAAILLKDGQYSLWRAGWMYLHEGLAHGS